KRRAPPRRRGRLPVPAEVRPPPSTPPSVFPDVRLVCFDPVLGDLPLRLAQRYLSVADHALELVLQPVLLLGMPGPEVRLGPEVALVGRMAADLKRDQVVFLVVPGRLVAVLLLLKLALLEARGVRGRGTDRVRPSWNANRVIYSALLDVRVGPARCLVGIRQLTGEGGDREQKEGCSK